MGVKKKQDRQCMFCSYTCNCDSELEQHVRKHTHEKPFVCDKCGQGFSIKGNLRRHILYMHQKELSEKFKCSLCSYAACHKYKLEEHIRSHTGERIFPCQHPNCGYAAKRPAELRSHDIHKHQNERKFLCQVRNCAFQGKTAKALRLHSATHSDCKPFVCDFEGCSYRAKFKGALKEHQLGVHSGGYKPFACSTCDYRATSKGMVRSHEVIHREQKSVKCDLSGCSYSCKSKTALRSHILYQHTEKTIKCDFVGCSHTVASGVQLETHKKNVHYEKNYKCPRCNYRGANPQLLKSHMGRHNPRILCPTKGCTFQTRNRKFLEMHMRHHEENLVCSMDGCGFVGLSSSGWKRHMKLHDPSSRPFHCPLCSKHFPTKGCLTDHLIMHTREKPFKCPACDYGCVQTYRMADHICSIHSTVFPEFVPDNEGVCKHCGVNFCNAVGLAMHTMKVKTAVVMLWRLQVEPSPPHQSSFV